MRINISYKMTIVFGVIFTIILIVIYAYLRSNLDIHTYNRIKSNLERETLLAGSLLESYLKYGNGPFEPDNVADIIGEDLGLRTTIIGADGTLLGDSELDKKQLADVENHLYRDEVQQALNSEIGASQRFSTTLRMDMLYIATTFGEEPKGIVRLAMPLSEIEFIANRIRKLLVIAVLVAFAATVGISILASVLISRPIRNMSAIAKCITEGDYSKTIPISSNDEIGDLARTFNNMTVHIRQDIEEISSNKLRLEAVLLSMSEGVMAVDSKGLITLMNDALKEFLIVGDNPHGRKPIEVVRNVEIQKIVDESLKLQTGIRSNEITVLVPEKKSLLIHANPIVREGKSEGAVLVFHNITELKRLEQIRRDFVANVSHELRTPVSNIKGYAETLLEGAFDDKDNAENFLRIIYSESERLTTLITDLLSLSEIESGRLKMSLKPCGIAHLIEKAVSSFEKQATEKSISIEINIPVDTQEVLADETMLTQVLLNLIDNAIKYTLEKGEINISAEEQGQFISVHVSDTGIGIHEKDIQRIFERFYRVDKARSRRLGGTGLGLSIVKHIIQTHGGEVSVESVLGQGSTFSFTIPKA